ncbi:MAG: LutB/LldF family L-lactate oxidation iron-sulfur protein [Mycobacterium leprae]
MKVIEMDVLERRIEAALANDHLRGALRYTTERLYSSRLRAIAELNRQAEAGLYPERFADLRARGHAIKAGTMSRLDWYLKQAADNIRAAGGKVYWALDGDEAVSQVLGICRQAGAKRVVKSKSMASEEIHLNGALEEAGLEVVESDLGEYIIQLAHERPAHIVIPAIHKTRQQIADLFEKEGGEPLATDTRTLTTFARKVMRQKYQVADVAITGANFVVAETGTLCLVTNEGNEGLATAIPPVHIAVVGLEKVVPRLDDLAVLLALLGRSATGQKLTSYTDLITGPRREGDLDGAAELHVIFLDNGRSGILGTKYAEALYCIRCGSCLNACPVYRNIGGHAYGGTYPGPIGAVLMPLLGGLDHWAEQPQLSSLCGACFEACPVGIHLPDYLVHLRGDAVETGHVPRKQLVPIRLWMKLWTRPSTYRLVAKAGYRLTHGKMTKLVTGEEVVEQLPFPASGWTDTRNFPAVAKRPFHARWADLSRGEAE